MSALGQKRTWQCKTACPLYPRRHVRCTSSCLLCAKSGIRVRHPLKDMRAGQRLCAAAGAIVNREFESHLGALLLDGN